jgi:hypothetical protein
VVNIFNFCFYRWFIFFRVGLWWCYVTMNKKLKTCRKKNPFPEVKKILESPKKKKKPRMNVVWMTYLTLKLIIWLTNTLYLVGQFISVNTGAVLWLEKNNSIGHENCMTWRSFSQNELHCCDYHCFPYLLNFCCYYGRFSVYIVFHDACVWERKIKQLSSQIMCITRFQNELETVGKKT